MPAALKDLISSKKFISAVVAIITLLGLRLGVKVDEVTAGLVATVFVALITGQAVADIGKAKAEIVEGKTLDEVRAASDARTTAAAAAAAPPAPTDPAP